MQILKKEISDDYTIENEYRSVSYLVDFFGFPLWLDVTFDGGNDPYIDWQKYIFFDNCKTDQVQKKIQNNLDYFQEATAIIYDDLEKNNLIIE